MGIPLYVICCFSLVAFNILSLSLIFVSLINMCLGLFLLVFIQYGTLSALPGLECFLSHFREVLGKFLAILSFFLIYLIYFWLHWVFVAEPGLSLVVASEGYSSSRCTGFSSQWLLLLQSMGSRHVGFSSCGMWAQ